MQRSIALKNYTEFIENLKTLISYKTVAAPAEANAPFGKENLKALNFVLELAKSFGFETINYDNYAGEIVFGEGEEIGIIGHLDVVPTGIGWETDPYTLTLKDGYYYARGIVDDKAAILLCLYALKELKDSGTPVNRKFRFFVGCNEESDWKDLEYVKSKTQMPYYGFSPDGNFPVIYSEKSMTNVYFELPLLKNFFGLKAGTIINAVCDYACVNATEKGINKEVLSKYGLKLKDGCIIESFGRAAHSSAPHLGENALKPLFEYFLEMGEDVKNVVDYMFYDKGEISKMKNEQGLLTSSPDLAEEKDGKIIIGVNYRIPAPLTKNDLIPVLDKLGLKYTLIEDHEPVMVQKDGWFVQTMLDAFNKISGRQDVPIAMGGSSFARAFKQGCAFGPDFRTYDTHCHDANERIKETDLLTAYEIYKKTIFDFAK